MGQEMRAPVPARRLGALLYAASEAVQLVADQALEPLGIGVRHFTLLTFLTHEAVAAADPIHEALTGRAASGAAALSQQAIGVALRIDRTTMVALVDDLEQLSLVRRERNPADRRAYAIRLTSKGADLQRRAEEALNGEAEKFFGPLSENERAALGDFLTRLLEHSRVT
jgi:DNA-binding MarR family transcriptional regulator